jgi:hypothetical protein
MGEYDSAVALAARLLAKKGRDVVLLRSPSQPVADSSKPWRVGSSTYTQVPLRAVFLDAPLERFSGPRAGDERWCIIAGSSVETEPRTDELVQDGALTYSIEAVTRLQPGDAVVAYSLKVTQWQST